MATSAAAEALTPPRPVGNAAYHELRRTTRPELFDWYFDGIRDTLFRDGRVEFRLKELLRLKLSLTHGCHTCNASNLVTAVEAGVTQEQIDAIDDIDGGPWSPVERAVLRVGEAMAFTNTHGYVDDALYAQLREHFDDDEILELGHLAAAWVGMAKFFFVFDLAEREETCPIKRHAA